MTIEEKIEAAERVAPLFREALMRIAAEAEVPTEALLGGAQAELTRMMVEQLDADEAIACHLRAAQWLIMINPTCRHALDSLPQAGRC